MNASILLRSMIILLMLAGAVGEHAPVKGISKSSVLAKTALTRLLETGPDNPIFLPFVTKTKVQPGFDTFEPNDKSQPFGPLVPGKTYTSYLSSDRDEDWYVIDNSSVLNNDLLIELTGSGSMAADLEIELYSFFSPCPMIVSDFEGSTETVQLHHPYNRIYQLRVYRWSGSPVSPSEPYFLKFSYPEISDEGDIWGKLDADSKGKGHDFYMSLDHYNARNRLINRYYTTIDHGEFHFRGIPDLLPGESYEPYFRNRQRDNCYITDDSAGFAGRPRITSYTAGSTVYTGELDIHDIKLGGPNDYGWAQEFPVNFFWTPRPTAPDESYSLFINNSYYNQFWSSAPAGHASSYAMFGFPSGLTPNRRYLWGVIARQPDGGYAGSFYENTVIFSELRPSKSESSHPINNLPAFQESKTGAPVP